MGLITCQAWPNHGAELCAQPGTDVFGHPWSSWKHGGPACKCATGECMKGRQRAEVRTIPVLKITSQMELAL